MRTDIIQEIIDIYNRDYPTASGEFDEFFHDVLNVLHNAKSEWISVKDRLPDDDELVLVYTKDGVMSVCSLVVANAFANLKNFKILEDNDGYDVCDVTHWMPLPKRPKENNND